VKLGRNRAWIFYRSSLNDGVALSKLVGSSKRKSVSMSSLKLATRRCLPHKPILTGFWSQQPSTAKARKLKIRNAILGGASTRMNLQSSLSKLRNFRLAVKNPTSALNNDRLAAALANKLN